MIKIDMAKKVLDEYSNLLYNLYERWQDEKEYEDFNDYVEAFKKHIPETIKGTRRPFGFHIKCDNGILAVEVKRSGNYLKINFSDK